MELLVLQEHTETVDLVIPVHRAQLATVVEVEVVEVEIRMSLGSGILARVIVLVLAEQMVQ
jgi:hypothetical protein